MFRFFFISELKYQIIKEFDKKNEEIANLQSMLKKAEKEVKLMKCRKKVTDFDKLKDDSSKVKLSEALRFCTDLINKINELITVDAIDKRKNRNILNSARTLVESATSFLTGNIYHCSISIVVIKYFFLHFTDNDCLISNFKDLSLTRNPLSDIYSNMTDNENEKQNDIDGNKSDKLNVMNYKSLKKSSNQYQCEESVKSFLNTVNCLKKLIEDFHSNKVSYKEFSEKLDSIFKTLSHQHDVFTKFELSKQESDERMKYLEERLHSEFSSNERVVQHMKRQLSKMDQMCTKVKDCLL